MSIQRPNSCCCYCCCWLSFILSFFFEQLNFSRFSARDWVETAASSKLCYTILALITQIICNNRRQIKCKTCQATHRSKNNVLRFHVDKNIVQNTCRKIPKMSYKLDSVALPLSIVIAIANEIRMAPTAILSYFILFY